MVALLAALAPVIYKFPLIPADRQFGPLPHFQEPVQPFTTED
ncbi:hypothetical protein [Larkinella terrae]|nr:hypothetical protein [Larkinella terrae]